MDEDPLENELPDWCTPDALREAVAWSGYPLQSEVAGALKARDVKFVEEWAFYDPENHKRRTIDLLAHRQHGADAELSDRPGTTLVRISTELVIECKQSVDPFVFFEAVSPPSLQEMPVVAGIGDGEMKLKPVTTPKTGTSSYEVSLPMFLGAQREEFHTEPPAATGMSGAKPKGGNRAPGNGEPVLTGDELYNGLFLPLTKALDAYAAESHGYRGSEAFKWVRFIHGLAVINGPMLLASAPPAEPELRPVRWLRMIVRKAADPGDAWAGKGGEHWAVDVVHASFVEEFLDTKLLPFAETLTERFREASNEVLRGTARYDDLDALDLDHDELWRSTAGPNPLVKALESRPPRRP